MNSDSPRQSWVQVLDPHWRSSRQPPQDIPSILPLLITVSLQRKSSVLGTKAKSNELSRNVKMTSSVPSSGKERL